MSSEEKVVPVKVKSTQAEHKNTLILNTEALLGDVCQRVAPKTKLANIVYICTLANVRQQDKIKWDF